MKLITEIPEKNWNVCGLDKLLKKTRETGFTDRLVALMTLSLCAGRTGDILNKHSDSINIDPATLTVCQTYNDKIILNCMLCIWRQVCFFCILQGSIVTCFKT